MFNLVELLYKGDSNFEPEEPEVQTSELAPAVRIRRIIAPEPLPTRPIISQSSHTKKRGGTVERLTLQKKSTIRRRNQPVANLADYGIWEVVYMS